MYSLRIRPEDEYTPRTEFQYATLDSGPMSQRRGSLPPIRSNESVLDTLFEDKIALDYVHMKTRDVSLC